MEAVLQSPFASVVETLRTLPAENAARWSKVIQSFFDLERKEMLEKEPSAEDLAAHRKIVKGLMRLTHMMLALSDPEELTNAPLIAEFEGRLIQLRHSWRQFQEPMSETEANKILTEVFPE